MALMVVREAAVGATRALICLLVWLGSVALVRAAVLPDDRSDAMYHSYVGDGVTIDGPSVLLRKKIGNQVSVSANYYVDTISGASIDVRAQASAYREQRTETSVGVDYLHNRTLMNIGVTRSDEDDYQARAINLSVSQDFFGDLSTLTFRYGRGDDTIGRIGDPNFSQQAQRQNMAIGLTQVVTKHLIIGLNAENISDEGYLNNPYRAIRFLDPNSARGFSFVTERYPNTRVSNAFSINANYYLPYRASIYGDLRYYRDTWGIEANNVRLGYIHTFGDDWILDVRVRHYQQDRANFYQDLFNRADEFNFMARDKELSTYRGLMAGAALTYQWQFSQSSLVQRSTFNIEYDYMRFDYDDFRDATDIQSPVGEESLFGFSASLLRAYLSIWY